MLTITEWAKLNPDQLTSGIVEIFATENPVLAALPFINIAGNAYTISALAEASAAAVARGELPAVPSTIEDPAVLDSLRPALRRED